MRSVDRDRYDLREGKVGYTQRWVARASLVHSTACVKQGETIAHYPLI